MINSITDFHRKSRGKSKRICLWNLCACVCLWCACARMYTHACACLHASVTSVCLCSYLLQPAESICTSLLNECFACGSALNTNTVIPRHHGNPALNTITEHNNMSHPVPSNKEIIMSQGEVCLPGTVHSNHIPATRHSVK